ncbi:MAG: proteasome subunit alpha [Acidimicrobiales bacterium]|nr:proteasome subunit alpha [Acidimicrobiales bacterium]
MTMPMYVSPEQLMKDRADYARKGISRGRAAVACTYADGVLLCAENPSNTLRKVGEIYDRIAFVGVGKYSEFDQLRIAGVRHADLKGYSFSRDDVDALWLANQYAQTLGQYFTHEMKPLEVEMIVAEIGEESASDQLFHLLYDGTVMDTRGFVVIGGEADVIRGRMEEGWGQELALSAAVSVSVTALAGPDRTLVPDDLEVAVLSRENGRRAFGRLEGGDLAGLLD